MEAQIDCGSGHRTRHSDLLLGSQSACFCMRAECRPRFGDSARVVSATLDIHRWSHGAEVLLCGAAGISRMRRSSKIEPGQPVRSPAFRPLAGDSVVQWAGVGPASLAAGEESPSYEGNGGALAA